MGRTSIPGMGQQMLRLRCCVCPIPGMLLRTLNLHCTRKPAGVMLPGDSITPGNNPRQVRR